MDIRPSRGLRWLGLGAAAAFMLLASSAGAANQGDALRLGLANTINLSTTLGGNTPAPQLVVTNSNTGAFGAIRAQSGSTAAGTFSIYSALTSLAPGGNSAALRGENKGTNANGYGVWGSQAGGGTGVYGTSATGTGVYGKHISSSGAGAAVRGDSASTAASAFSVYGLLSSTTPGSGSAAVRGQNNATNSSGYGVWGSQAGSGTGVYGTSVGGVGVYGSAQSLSSKGVYGTGGTGVEGVSSGVAGIGVRGYSSGGYGVDGESTSGWGVYALSTSGTGVYGFSSTSKGVEGDGSTYGVRGNGFGSNGAGVYGSGNYPAAYGVLGKSDTGTGVRGESTNFQGVSGFSVHNAGIVGTTTDGFASYFVGPTEQHGALNVYDHTASVVNGNMRIARDTSTFSGTGAALQVEHAGTNGEAAWLRLGNAGNGNAVLMLVRPTGTGDFMRCYQQGTNEGQKCHINSDGTFVGGSDFAEALPAQGRKAAFEPGDVLSMSVAHPGQVVRSQHARDRALIGVYSTRPAVLGADKGGLTRVGKNDVPVAITGIVSVKVTARNGAIRPGDLLTSSNIPGRAMNAGASPRIGTVLGKALGSLRRGQGTIKMLVMLR